MSRIKLISIVALFAGPALAISTRNKLDERATIERDGVTVPGLVTDGQVIKKRRSKSYDFEVLYAPKDGETATKKFSVPKEFAEGYVKDDAFVRYDVQVRCLPNAPQSAFIVGAGDGDPELEMVGYGIGAFGLVGAFFSFRRKKEPLEA